MQLAHVRFTVRSVLIGVALVAVYLALIRMIEQENQRSQAWEQRQVERRWRDASSIALQRGDSAGAASYRQLADSCAIERKSHEDQSRIFPRSFCRQSILFTLVYIWAIAFFLVVRSERSESGLVERPTRGDRTAPPPFLIWVGLG